MATNNVAAQLPANMLNAIATRLAKLEGLQLPFQQFNRIGMQESDFESRRDHLVTLATRDAGVFLERHGRHLTNTELALFECLRAENFEVDFHLRQFQSQTATSSHKFKKFGSATTIPAVVKNRRLAALRRLESEGEFFTEEAMRSRDPALYHLFIGQYEEGSRGAIPPAGGQHASTGTTQHRASPENRSLAGSIQYQQDELMLLLRREAEWQRWVEAEHENGSESETDQEQVMDGKLRERHVLEMRGRDGDGAHATNSCAWYTDRRERYLSLLDAMQQRFLGGFEPHLDMEVIDQDESLDDVSEAERDREEEYFAPSDED